MAGIAEPSYRTISDVSEIVGVPQHVLRFWETRFSQIVPLKRGGNRRYYRPADVDLLVRINRLLYTDGYTIKGVQKLLADDGVSAASDRSAKDIKTLPAPARTASPNLIPPLAPRVADGVKPALPAAQLVAIRARLAAALAEARAV